MNNKLITPFGEIKICIDDNEIEYTAHRGKALENLCPDIIGRYQIEVLFIPDGNEHKISCTFPTVKNIKGYGESGEDLECQGFYGEDKIKLSIGTKCESGLLQNFSDKYDYDVEYLENGMEYLILSETKTEKYVFGIAWIDEIDVNDKSELAINRDTQTWFAADPTLSLDAGELKSFIK